MPRQPRHDLVQEREERDRHRADEQCRVSDVSPDGKFRFSHSSHLRPRCYAESEPCYNRCVACLRSVSPVATQSVAFIEDRFRLSVVRRDDEWHVDLCRAIRLVECRQKGQLSSVRPRRDAICLDGRTRREGLPQPADSVLYVDAVRGAAGADTGNALHGCAVSPDGHAVVGCSGGRGDFTGRRSMGIGRSGQGSDGQARGPRDGLMNMSPNLAARDVADRREINAEIACDGEQLFTSRPPFANPADLCLRQLGRRVRLSSQYAIGMESSTIAIPAPEMSSAATFGIAVGVIVRSCSKKQMCGVDARGVVTSMQNAEAIWNCPVVNYPRDTVGEVQSSVETEAPVAIDGPAQLPLQAVSSGEHMSPQVVWCILSHSRVEPPLRFRGQRPPAVTSSVRSRSHFTTGGI